jgi:hypothetical protein
MKPANNINLIQVASLCEENTKIQKLSCRELEAVRVSRGTALVVISAMTLEKPELWV